MTASIETTVCPIDAFDNLTLAREILHWMAAVNWAAAQAMKAGHTDYAKHLAGLGQHISDDWANHFDVEAEKLAIAHGVHKQ